MDKNKTAEHRLSKRTRRFLVVFLGICGTCLALFVGGYVMFLHPLWELLQELKAGTVTKQDVFLCALSVFFAATAGGGIWCAFDILANFFRDRDE